MRLAGRISASIEILEDFFSRRVPLKVAIADWARGARYAGAKDRAWISGLCLDVLRRRNSLAATMEDEAARGLVLGALRFLWQTPVDALDAVALETPHGPGALTDREKAALSADLHTTRDYPDWLAPAISRAFGEDADRAMAALSERADIDLRINTLKVAPGKAAAALKQIGAEPSPLLTSCLRIAAPPPSERAPAVTVLPAFNKGWIEVQDLGSQIAAAAAGVIKGAQVLDYCAGGGGKTLALAALMENTGQLYATDSDAHRLKPLFERARRAAVRNLQIRSWAGGGGVSDLEQRMDVVFVDAPCSGSGTWRRHPDTKWRLTPQQLERRLAEQDRVLAEAARCVRPGGRLVWATCSFLKEENEDRLEAFVRGHPDFHPVPVLPGMLDSGLVTEPGREALKACATSEGAMRLAPEKLRADGFYIAVLTRLT